MRLGLAAMRFGPVEDRIDRYDPVWIYAFLTVVVVAHDVVEMHRLRHAGSLVQFPGVGPEMRIVDQAVSIALEVRVVNRIEAKQRRSQPPVGFGDAGAHQIALP